MSVDWGAGSVTRKLTKPRSGTVAVLDIGTSKVCCLIARTGRPAPDGANTVATQPRLIGAGHQVSRGVRNGTIVNVDATEDAIRKAVHMAEQMAQETINSVTVNLSAGAPVSEILSVDVDIGGQQIDESDLHRIFQQTHSLRDNANGTSNDGTNGKDRELIHSIPVGFSIDGQQGIADPRGMFGQKLSVNMHLVSASANAVRTIRAAIERCHLEIDGFVLSPYAAGLATLVEDESDLGTTVVDMGGGTTGLSIFYDGEMIFADTIPVGGNHVTADIARGLSTPLTIAERLKTLFGNAIATESDEHEMLDVPQVGEDEHTATHQFPRSLLNGIIQPRIEETFELVRSRLDDSGLRCLRRTPRGVDRRSQPASGRARSRGAHSRQTDSYGSAPARPRSCGSRRRSRVRNRCRTDRACDRKPVVADHADAFANMGSRDALPGGSVSGSVNISRNQRPTSPARSFGMAFLSPCLPTRSTGRIK